jgi:general secretion pathway protein G
MTKDLQPQSKTKTKTGHERGGRRGPKGFTIIELMIVITIILILVGMAVGRYEKSVLRSREAVLAHNLHVLRDAIDNYTLDKQSAPQSLDDLVQAGYLREVPTDPMTRQKDWQTKFGNTVLTPDQTSVGIEDVHSNSDQSGTDGTPYNQW